VSIDAQASYKGISIAKEEPEVKTKPVLIASALAVLTMAGAPSEAKTIRFSGYDWTVKSGDKIAPGPNNWDENNVSVDERGDLHLRLTQRDGKWYSSQVSLNDRLGFGRYQFWVIGRVDEFDANVVLGLFNYPPPDVGPGRTNEIDIEFAKWGHTTAPIGNYTRLAYEKGSDKGSESRFRVLRSGPHGRVHDAQVHLEFDERVFPVAQGTL
jgi:hypothetical protein